MLLLTIQRRYLILDILGQGTFGQVVKCQNMKTHEIVAVKVVKNKPAYFNQSMMEVTILELVRGELLIVLMYANILLVAQQNMRSERRTPYTSASRFIYPPTTSLSGV